ncbi:hypothetical protein CLW00_106273 [Mongoliibacter ruber]|uniref:Uncharacterized protein n=2 Tax=Mongoliibacter ruber TaxID=1750599 RepID=A0A2T0WLS3_9BACT|nr:hypothetical protein CLW00_106273 [Mongoliibacter ruber]
MDRLLASIEYNHLNLPSKYTFTTTIGSIENDYDALGNKLTERLYQSVTLNRTRDYIGEFVFENGELDHILHEEGRVVVEGNEFHYEFFVKDHLGSVRQVIRAPISTVMTATMEPVNAEEEEKHFQNIRETRQGAGEHNKTPGGYATAWLNADRNRILGPLRIQEVQMGDHIDLSVFGKYVEPKKLKLLPASFFRTGMDRKLIPQLTEFGQNLRSAGTNELAIANVVALVIAELQQKPVPEAYMAYALYDSDSVLYEQENQALRNSPVDCFSLGPGRGVSPQQKGKKQTRGTDQTDRYSQGRIYRSIPSPKAFGGDFR